jgi:sugar lactone lactonase YvrE
MPHTIVVPTPSSAAGALAGLCCPQMTESRPGGRLARQGARPTREPRRHWLLWCIALVLLGCSQPKDRPPHLPTGVLAARWHDSGFAEGDDNYNAVTAASDGKIYYVLCAHNIDVGAQMYSYDPATGRVKHLGDLTEAVGEKGLKAIPQGKSHVSFYEHQGKLYFATHLGYYQNVGGKELVGVPPPGYKPYPGGHFLSYHIATGKFEKLASAPAGEGIITMAMDPKRGRLYGLTWPSAKFLVYDLAKKELKDLGFTSEKGEKGLGPAFRVVGRSIAVDPVLGAAHFTVSTGDILRYGDPRQKNELEKLSACTMKREVFGTWDPNKPGHMGYHWRQTVWYEPEKVFYGNHGNTGFLFRFDPRGEQIEVIDRIAAEKSKLSGLFDAFDYGYLGLTLGPDGHTLYFLTGTPAGEEVHFVTYHIPTRKYTDHGALALDDGRRPTWAQAIAVGQDKRVYTVSKIKQGDKLKTDLLSFADPLQTPPAPEPSYKLVRSWLNPGGMPNPLQEAHSLCFDPDGNLILVDSVGSRVHRFTPEGAWLGEIGSGPGQQPGQFNAPREARVHKNGEIFVSDANNHRIQVFSHQGRFLRMFGEKGSGPGQLLRAHGLAFSPDFTRLYVVDVDNNRVSVFDPAGKFLLAFGKKGVRTGEFRDAHGLGVAPNGDVIVSNYYGPAQRFTADGRFLYDFAPAGFRGWVHFHSMTTDRAGNTYLAARNRDGRNAIVKYDHRGAYVTAWAASTAEGEQGVKTAAVDAKGQVYVAVEGRALHGVQVFSMSP